MSQASQTCGAFSPDGRCFVQTNPRTPRPWINRMWSDHFLMTCSQVAQGEALIQDADGKRHTLHNGRMVYLVDVGDGSWWTANGLPLPPVSGHSIRLLLDRRMVRGSRRGQLG